MTVQETAARLRITRQGVHGLIRSGSIRARRAWTRKGPALLVYRASVEAYAKKRRAEKARAK